jgi:hypothetical protein
MKQCAKRSNPIPETWRVNYKLIISIGVTTMCISKFMLLTIALLWAFPFTVSTAIDQDVIVLALSFDEGKGRDAKDISSQGNHGVLSETAKWAQGKIGMCARLKNAYVEVANHPTLSLHDTDFTMAIWLNFAEEESWYDLIAHNEAPAIDVKKWIWMFAGGKFKFHINDRGVKIAWIDSEFFGFPELDRWYHLALVKQGNQYTHYLDGEFFGEETDDTPIPDEIDHVLTIGSGPGDRFIQGFVDELFITRQPLTQNDILNHFAGGVQGVLSVELGDKLATRWGDLKTGRTSLPSNPP